MSSLDPLGIGTTEKAWDALLFGAKGVATTLGWDSYHTLRSKGSKAGWPDRSCWRERVIFVELKTMAKASKLSPLQVEVLTGMAKAGAECYVWRPDDYNEAVEVLGRHQVFMPNIGALLDKTRGEQPWKPRSLWLPAGARRDTLESSL